MNRSRSSGKLELQTSGPLSDEQLYQLILNAYEETQDTEHLQMIIKSIMIDDPERIRVAYRRVVEMKTKRGRNRAASEHRPDHPPRRQRPSVTLALVDGSGNNNNSNSNNSNNSSSSSRASQRRQSTPKPSTRKRNHLSAVVDASGMQFGTGPGGLSSLRSEMAALCRVQHQNLLNLLSFSAIKGGRFALDFDLVNTSHVTLLDMFQEEADGRSLNGCEVACVLAQASLGLLFLSDCAGPVLEPIVLNLGACLLTESIILTDRGLIKLCGHHPVLRLPRRTLAPASALGPSNNLATASPLAASPVESDDAMEPEMLMERPSCLAHGVALLLYELDHPRHETLRSPRLCPVSERSLLDKRYAGLFSLCSDWTAELPQLDMRRILYSDFINEQTSAIGSYQIPLEIVFASRFG